MENSGDKYASLIIPNCRRTSLQDEKLQSCPFARESKVSSDDTIPSSSSTEEPPEQATGIEMLTLSDSEDEYQTPPEQPFSQNSSNDGREAAIKIAAFVRLDDDDDDDNEPQGQRIVDLADELDNLDTEKIDVDDGVDEMVTEGFETEVIYSQEEGAHKVFVEMPQREEETSDVKKRKLPFLMDTQKQKSKYCKHEGFKDTLNRVLKMVGVGGSRGGGEEDDDADVDINILETAKMRGLTLPRPRWWPV